MAYDSAEAQKEFDNLFGGIEKIAAENIKNLDKSENKKEDLKEDNKASKNNCSKEEIINSRQIRYRK